MTSKTDMLKGACIKLGVARPASFNEETEPARLAREIFPRLARAELRKHPWSFAITSTSLGRLADPVGGNFRAAFNLPTDLLRILQFNNSWIVFGLSVVTDGSDAPYTIEGRTLLSNDATARIRYVRDLSEDTALWDASFVEAFTCMLAVEMAPSLTKDKQKVRDCTAQYRQAIADARRANALEQPPAEIPDGSWVVSRFT